MPDMKNKLLLKIAGLTVSVLPTFLSVISYFPIWKERGGEAMLSGISLCLILITAIPVFRTVKSVFRTPSAPIVWLMIFILFFALSKIAEDITVIAFVGFVSNLIGSLLFTLARKKEKDKEI